MFKTTYQRRLFITLLIVAMLAPVVLIGGQLAMQNIRTSPTRWVPPTFQKRQEYDWFEQTFETNDSVVISWDSCTLGSSELDKLYQKLHAPDDSERGKRVKALVDRSFTGDSLLEEMQDYPLELRKDIAQRRLKNALIGPDGETTCCVVLLTEAGVVERKESIPLLQEIAAEVTGLEQDDLHMAGPIVDAYHIDEESVASMRWFAAPSMLVVLIMCRICLKSWPFTFLVFAIAVFGQMLTLALVYYTELLWDTEQPMNAVLIVMPPLVMVLTVSAAVHLVNYYHDEVRRGNVADAPRKALANGFLPCFLATVTTAIGLLSLVLSDIIPVKMFGMFATAGIGTTLLLLFLTLPGAQERWPVAAHEGRAAYFKDLSFISNFVCRYPTLIVMVGLIVLGTCGWGLQYLQTSVNVRSLFTPDSKILADYAWFEEHIGPMTPVEVVINFPDESDLDPLERLEVVSEIQKRVEQIDGVEGTMSAATFFRSIPRGFAARRATAIRLARSMEKFDQINYYADEGEAEGWRISGRVAALGRIDYGEFLAEIQQEIDPRLWAVQHIRAVDEVFRDKSRRDLADLKVAFVGGDIDKARENLDRLLKQREQVDQEAVEDEDAPDETTTDDYKATDATEVYLAQFTQFLYDRGFELQNLISAAGDDQNEIEQANLIVFVAPQASVTYETVSAGDTPVVDARQHAAGQSLSELPDERLVTATYTGVMPLAYEVQNALLTDLIKSFLAAVALVTVVMIFLQRSPLAGTVAMLPNIFPMVVLFGITSWRRMPIDIGTVMTASVALGIAVDDTLHFLTWFNREHTETGDNVAAVKLAFRHCAKAMLQTTLICSLGLVIYSFSWFMPTRRFSWMMVTLLMAAVIGDLVLLPALLAGPLGKMFPKRMLIGDPLAKADASAPAATANPEPV